MPRFGVRSGSVVFARSDEDPVNKRFERTGANWREHRSYLPCKRSRVRVPSASQTPLETPGFFVAADHDASPPRSGVATEWECSSLILTRPQAVPLAA
jgi:hypothetical protein